MINPPPLTAIERIEALERNMVTVSIQNAELAEVVSRLSKQLLDVTRIIDDHLKAGDPPALRQGGENTLRLRKGH